MFRNVAVSTNPGADSRVPEVAGTRKLVEELGCSLNQIKAPGTLDGGDILKVGDTVYVGRGGLTPKALRSFGQSFPRSVQRLLPFRLLRSFT